MQTQSLQTLGCFQQNQFLKCFPVYDMNADGNNQVRKQLGVKLVCFDFEI